MKNVRALVMALVFAFALPGTPLAQVRDADRGPAPKAASGGGRGFGFAIDLGSLVKAIAAPAVEERFTSPDTRNLPQFEPRQLIVSWAAAQRAQVQGLLAAAPGAVLSNLELPNLEIGIAVVSFQSQAQADQTLAAWQAATPPVTADRQAIAYPMQEGHAAPVRQYALDLLKAPARTAVQGSVVVGVVDTEVASSAALNTASHKSRRLFPDSEKAAPTDHGSGVTAIVAASRTDAGFQGLAQGIHLRSAGVMREMAPGISATNTLLIAQALDWLIGENAQVVNLSLGSASDKVLAAVIDKTLSLGIVLVAAAGNGGSDAPPSYPAAYPGVIAVTAVDANKALYARANRGTYVTIAAPGVDVWVPVGKGKYMTGTSFAAPFVAATIAQRLASQPQPRSPQATQSLIKGLCGTALPLAPANPSPEFGCGLMQL